MLFFSISFPYFLFHTINRENQQSEFLFSCNISFYSEWKFSLVSFLPAKLAIKRGRCGFLKFHFKITTVFGLKLPFLTEAGRNNFFLENCTILKITHASTCKHAVQIEPHMQVCIPETVLISSIPSTSLAPKECGAEWISSIL